MKHLEDVIKTMKFEMTESPVPIPISTRGVGFSVQETYTMVTSVQKNVNRLPPMTVHQFYRVMLGMVEFKVFKNRRSSVLNDGNLWYQPQQFEEFQMPAMSINVCPKRISCILKSIENFCYKEINYVPLLPSAEKDRARRVIPSPELVCLTNLREYCEYLHVPATNRDIRQNFEQRCPIPRANWGGDSVLINIDDIMPANYTREDFSDDVYAVKHWIEANLKGSKNKWFSDLKTFERGTGNEGVLVSSDSSRIRCRIRGDIHDVEGDTQEFWVMRKINEVTTFYGIYGLVGELASVAEYLYPRYCGRVKTVAPFRIRTSYREICQKFEMC